MPTCDVAIIGGGIVGLATAYRLGEKYSDKKIIVLEKEPDLARHQTGHNSGVIHSGIYYKPGSLKAENCRQGNLALQEFCREHEIPFEMCGKVIVAVSESELPALGEIARRGAANGVSCELIDRARLAELEPHAAGIRAIHVPDAGIVDYTRVCQVLAETIRRRGGEIITGAKVTSLISSEKEVRLVANTGEYQAKLAVNCAGLYCDRVTKLAGQRPPAKIVPFRGEYYQLKDDAPRLCRNLIYPVPDPAFPFLGVHFTRMISGHIECGPNAVLAFAREGYHTWKINPRDLAETLTYGGFLRLAAKYWKTGAGEMWRSFSKHAFVKALQRLVPDIRVEHLETAPAGVRAQAIAPDGKMVDDFLITEGERIVHVGNAPSPAATSSLNIGRLIVEKLAARLD